MPSRLTEWSALVVFLCGAVLASGQPYFRISAEFEWIGARVGDTNSKPRPRLILVTCITGTNEWWMEEDFAPRGTYGTYKWRFDGTNVYESLRVPAAEDETSKAARLGFEAPVPPIHGKITIHVWPSRDGHPMGDSAVNLGWLAFCSGSYLKRPGRVVPLTLDNLHNCPDRFAYSDVTIAFKDDFGLPRWVELFTSKELYLKSVQDFDKEYHFGKRYSDYERRTAANLKEGALVFHYAVTEWTNFLGWTFPLRFEFFQSGRQYIQNGNWMSRGTGRVKSIESSERPPSIFEPKLQQIIVDWRFPSDTGMDALTYMTTRDFVAPTNDPALQERFQRQLANRTASTVRASCEHDWTFRIRGVSYGLTQWGPVGKWPRNTEIIWRSKAHRIPLTAPWAAGLAVGLAVVMIAGFTFLFKFGGRSEMDKRAH